VGAARAKTLTASERLRKACDLRFGADHTVRIWDPASGQAIGAPLAGHTGQVRATTVATSADGHMILLSGGHDGTIRLWDLDAGTPYRGDPASL
jgi:WD40 repeat protein